MRLARVTGHECRVTAARDLRGVPAFCPVCDAPVIPKCGSIRPHHWAHKVADCDPWSEPESEWHRRWKELFPVECQEVRVGRHRADVKTDRLVIELQHSPISPEEIREREDFYGAMIWIFDLSDVDRIRMEGSSEMDGIGWVFWHRARESILTCRKPVFLELADGALINLFDYGAHRHPQVERWCWPFGYGGSYDRDEIVDHALGRTEAGAWRAQCARTPMFDQRPWPRSVLESDGFVTRMIEQAEAARRRAWEADIREKIAIAQAEMRANPLIIAPAPTTPEVPRASLPLMSKRPETPAVYSGGRATFPPESVRPGLERAAEYLDSVLGLKMTVDGPVALFLFATEPESEPEEEDATVVFTVGPGGIERAKRSELWATRLGGRGIFYPTREGLKLRVRTNTGELYEHLISIAAPRGGGW